MRFLYSFVIKVSWNRERTPFPKAAKGYKRRPMMERNSFSLVKAGDKALSSFAMKILSTYNQNVGGVFSSMAILTQWQLSLQGTLCCYFSIQFPDISQTQIWISHCILPCFPLHHLWAFLPGSARMTKPTFVVKSKLSGSHNTRCLFSTCYFQAICSVLQCLSEEPHGPWE